MRYNVCNVWIVAGGVLLEQPGLQAAPVAEPWHDEAELLQQCCQVCDLSHRLHCLNSCNIESWHVGLRCYSSGPKF